MFSVLRFENIDSSFLLNFSRKNKTGFGRCFFGASEGVERDDVLCLFFLVSGRRRLLVLCVGFSVVYFFFAFCVGKTAVAAGRGWPVGRLVSGQAERALLRCRKKNKGKQNNQLVHNQRVSDGELYGSMTCVLFFRPFHPIARRQTGVDEDVGAAALVAPTLAKSTLGAGFFFQY